MKQKDEIQLIIGFGKDVNRMIKIEHKVNGKQVCHRNIRAIVECRGRYMMQIMEYFDLEKRGM